MGAFIVGNVRTGSAYQFEQCPGAPPVPRASCFFRPLSPADSYFGVDWIPCLGRYLGVSELALEEPEHVQKTDHSQAPQKNGKYCYAGQHQLPNPVQ